MIGLPLCNGDGLEGLKGLERIGSGFIAPEAQHVTEASRQTTGERQQNIQMGGDRRASRDDGYPRMPQAMPEHAGFGLDTRRATCHQAAKAGQGADVIEDRGAGA